MPPLAFQARFDERNYRYYRVASAQQALKVWVVAHSGVITDREATDFANAINETARRKGLQLPKPSIEQVELNEMEAAFTALLKRTPRPQFITYIDTRRDRSHEVREPSSSIMEVEIKPYLSNFSLSISPDDVKKENGGSSLPGKTPMQ